jgi:hypothetical protein
LFNPLEGTSKKSFFVERICRLLPFRDKAKQKEKRRAKNRKKRKIRIRERKRQSIAKNINKQESW